MHLAGIKSETLSANEFYEACIEGTITREDCNPRRDANTMYSKVAIMEQMLNLRNSKCYKISEKNLVTRDNDFEMATGNVNGIMGYDSRIRIKGTNKVDSTKSPIPTTLLNNSITDYCSRPQKIMFILQKSDRESTYNILFYEIKRDSMVAKASIIKIIQGQMLLEKWISSVRIIPTLLELWMVVRKASLYD